MKPWPAALSISVGILLTGIAFVASLLYGPTDVPIETFYSLWSDRVWNDAELIVWDIRLPRSITTILVGASLAAAGATMQGVTQNPLAGPSIMGLSGGATLASLVSLIVWPSLNYNGSIIASFIGATLGYCCVLLVASMSRGGMSPTRLALAGTVVSSLFSAVTQGLIIALAMSSTMIYWTIGGVTNVTWEQVWAIVPCCLIGFLGLLWLSPGITILGLGEPIALNLGLSVVRVRILSTVMVLILTAASVAVAGPIAFIGLMTPHLCRFYVGADYRCLLPMSMIVGAGLTTFSDLIARIALVSSGELPLGVVTALIGAPCFLWLISVRRDSLNTQMPGQARSRKTWRPQTVLTSAAICLITTIAISLFSWDAEFPVSSIIDSLFGRGTPSDKLLIWSIRIPRIAFTTLVGMGVAVSGSIFQAVLRNDLAEPGVLGVSSGVTLGLLILFIAYGRSVAGWLIIMPLTGFVSGLGITLVVYLLSWGQQTSSPRLLLTGVAVGTVAGALTQLLSLQISSDTYAYVVAFSAGSMNSANWASIGMLSSILVLLLPLSWSFASTLNILQVGEHPSVPLGVRMPDALIGLLALGVALCASCMSLSGVVLFLGLIAPHIARQLIGNDQNWSIPLSAIIGATLLLMADYVGSNLIPGVEIPAGIGVSILGAPYFLYLLMRQ